MSSHQPLPPTSSLPKRTCNVKNDVKLLLFSRELSTRVSALTTQVRETIPALVFCQTCYTTGDLQLENALCRLLTTVTFLLTELTGEVASLLSYVCSPMFYTTSLTANK